MDEDRGMDLAQMDAAAGEAKRELLRSMEEWSALSVALWWNRWYMKAGHKRLGRVLVDLAKQSRSKEKE